METSNGSISYNSDQLEALGNTLDGCYKTICNEIEAIITEAEDLDDKGLWSGLMYDAFLANITNYKVQYINPLLEVIKSYIKEIYKTAESSRELTKAGQDRFA